jgi:putative flippase GtrA
MMEMIQKTIRRYRTELVYLVVGVLTTAVNYLLFFLLIGPLGVYYLTANAASWVVAILFAYFANRTWVFRSQNKKILAELWLFIASRIFSLLLETGLLYVAVDVFGAGEMIAKAVIAVVVVVCNYITGRFVFRK